MRIPFLKPKTRDYALEPLGADDGAGDLGDPPRGLRAALDRRRIRQPARRRTPCSAMPRARPARGGTAPVGFVLARLAAGEGEILTVAVARSHRRQGLGWRLMDAVLRELHAQRAEALFLEVDETNAAAHRALPAARLPRGRQAPGLLPDRARQDRRACHAARSSLALTRSDRPRGFRGAGGGTAP